MDNFEFKKFDSLVTKVYQSNKPVLLKFINETEQEYLINACGNKVKLLLDGGFVNSKRKRALIVPLDYDNSIDFKIKKYEVVYNKRFSTIEHRHVLGTLMSMGINRDVIGDIVINNGVYFSCTSEISSYLIEDFRTINHASISLVETQDEISIVDEFKTITISASSLRCDLIASSVYNFSRNKINEYFDKDLVIVNNMVCSKSYAQLKNSDVVNVRGKGKFKITEISDVNKKNKYKITVIVY